MMKMLVALDDDDDDENEDERICLSALVQYKHLPPYARVLLGLFRIAQMRRVLHILVDL